MSEPNADQVGPETGDAEIDGALAQLADLGSMPLGEHHDRLARAHEVLHSALDRTDDPDRG